MSSTASLQSAINILAEKETENNWTKKKDALDTIYTYAQNYSLNPTLQRQLLPSVLSVLATERSTLASSVSTFLSSLARLPLPTNELSSSSNSSSSLPVPLITGKFTVLFSEPLFTKLIELSQRKSSGVLARTTMRALLDILYYAPPSSPMTTILSAIAKCITKGGIVEHHTICRELCCRIINQILTIWPASLWNKVSFSNEDDVFITVLLLLLCDKDELIRRLARVNYRLFLARVTNPLLVRNFRNNDPSFSSHMAKVFDENECNKDVAAITRLNNTVQASSTNSNNTDTLPSFLLEFETTAEVTVKDIIDESDQQTMDTVHDNPSSQQENIPGGSNRSISKKTDPLHPASSLTTNNPHHHFNESLSSSFSSVSKSSDAAPTTMSNNPYLHELTLPLGSIVFSFASHTKSTLHSTMNTIHQLLPTLANLDKRAAAARVKHITEQNNQNSLSIATQILHEARTTPSTLVPTSTFSSSPPHNKSLPCIDNTNIQELQILANQTQELIKVLSASLPQLQNHLEIIQERIQRGEE